MSAREREHILIIDSLGRPHRSNDERKMNHWKLQRVHEQWRQAAAGHAMTARFPKGLGPCDVEAYGRYRRRPLPDVGAVSPSLKCCLDGLRDYGVWPDDTAEWVLSETCLPPVLDPSLPDALVVTVRPR